MRNSNSFTLALLTGIFGAIVIAASAQDTAPTSESTSEPASEPTSQPAEAAATETTAPEESGPTVYTIADNSTLSFVGHQVTGQREGGFERFEGTFTLDGEYVESLQIDVTIDATSLWADNERLMGHLQSADFFDVENFPEATFVSTSIGAEQGGDIIVVGDLTLHGETNTVSFELDLEIEESRLDASASFQIRRLDFGIAYPGRPDDLIADEVDIRFEITAVAE